MHTYLKDYLKLLIYIMVLIALGGCAALQKYVKKPTVAFVSVNFTSISLFEATPVFKLKVTNPNPVGTSIQRLKYSLEINGRSVVADELTQGMQLKANGSEFVEVPVTFKYSEVFNSVMDFMSQDQVQYEFKGTIGIGILDIPYQTKGSFNVPKLPDITLEKVRVDDLSFTGATVNIALSMRNRNDFAINMDRLEYAVKLAGNAFASGNAKMNKPLNQKGRSSIDLPVSINFLALGRSVSKMLNQSQTEYEVSGQMIFQVPGGGQQSFPFSSKGKVPIGN